MGSKNICDLVDVSRGGCVAPQSHPQLLLDSAKGELVKAPARVVKKTTTEAKALAALKNHSEAEKRRRQRINAHLSSLRGLVPSSTHKMDKATLLAEVITHTKELQKKAFETCQGLLLPMDRDEVTVEPLPCEEIHKNAFRVSLCFKYRHDVLVDLRKAISSLCLRIVESEMSTFGEWLKIAFIFFTNHESVEESGGKEMKISSIHRTLSTVLEKSSSSCSSFDDDNSPDTRLSKRRRVSVFESSSSSS